MNLSDVKTNLYKVYINEIPVQDYLGMHIGKDKPPRDINMPIPYKLFIYVAGKNTKEVVDFLANNGIDVLKLERIDVLLNV